MKKSEKPTESNNKVPRALLEYIKKNYTNQEIEELCANTGLPHNTVHSYVKHLYAKRGIDDDTEISLSVSYNKKNDSLSPSWYISKDVSIEAMYSFLKSLRDFSFNMIALDQLNSLTQNGNSKAKVIIEELFPGGLLDIQSIVDPILTIGDISDYES